MEYQLRNWFYPSLTYRFIPTDTNKSTKIINLKNSGRAGTSRDILNIKKNQQNDFRKYGEIGFTTFLRIGLFQRIHIFSHWRYAWNTVFKSPKYKIFRFLPLLGEVPKGIGAGDLGGLIFGWVGG